MAFNDIIQVNYKVYTSSFSIRKNLPKLLNSLTVASFDVETRSIYPKEIREEARNYLKNADPSDYWYKQARLVANSNGLSYPSIVKTTHFVIGESKELSHVFITDDEATELFIWKAVAECKTKLLVHNALFDLKIMHQRTGKLPVNFVDTALSVKCLINHVNIWKAKTGLKELMGGYYNPNWSLLADDYEPEDLKNKDFIEYVAIDGCACFYLYELINEEMAKIKGSV